jgi:hypothetical protein
MILEIKIKNETIDILGRYEPIAHEDLRECYIDGKKCPPGLRAIILMGLDVATEQYLGLVEDQMRKEGHKVRHYI